MSDQNFTRLEDSFSRAVCHDCMVEFTVGWDEANPEPCDYCYEVTEVYRITFRGKVLAKFHGEEPGVYEAAWAKYDELAATRTAGST